MLSWGDGVADVSGAVEGQGVVNADRAGHVKVGIESNAVKGAAVAADDAGASRGVYGSALEAAALERQGTGGCVQDQGGAGVVERTAVAHTERVAAEETDHLGGRIEAVHNQGAIGET